MSEGKVRTGTIEMIGRVGRGVGRPMGAVVGTPAFATLTQVCMLGIYSIR